MRPELVAVLAGLARNRTPGWNFPANFLDLSFDAFGAEQATVSIVPGPHCIDLDGNTHLAAACLLADIGMGAAMRRQFGLATRMGTVSMTLQFTRAFGAGLLESRGIRDATIGSEPIRQGLARAELYANGAQVLTASGSFISLGNQTGLSPVPIRKRGVDAPIEPLDPRELDDGERLVYQHAQASLDAPGGFLTHFWNLVPVRSADGAECDFDNDVQVGNRSGHTQGGISFALGIMTAEAALEPGWRIVSATGSYISPGTGARLRCEARAVHRGRTTAVMRSTVRNEQGRIVIETTSNHSRL